MTRTLELLAALLMALAVAVGSGAGCDASEGAAPVTSVTGPSSNIAIEIAPLELTDVTNALYSLTVQNNFGDIIVGATISSQFYGDGAGSALYIAPCDADPAVQPNRVTVTLLQLFGESGPVAVEKLPQLTREVVCESNRDTLVEFDVTVVRSSEQGFFDIKVTYADIFCSATLDCVDGFFDDVNTTAVLGFACTAGDGLAETSLYMSNITVSCSFESVVIDPDVDGRVPESHIARSSPLWPMVAGVTVYRGEDAISDVNNLYWNVAIGVTDLGALDDCQLHAIASATEVPLPGPSPYPLEGDYPFVKWQVPLTQDGAAVCGHHPVSGEQSGVSIEYSTIHSPVDFDHTFGGPN